MRGPFLAWKMKSQPSAKKTECNIAVWGIRALVTCGFILTLTGRFAIAQTINMVSVGPTRLQFALQALGTTSPATTGLSSELCQGY